MSSQKKIAVIAFRNEEKHLSGLFSHLSDYVDGFVAFDDCSTDNSFEIARQEPKMVGVFQRKTPSPDHHFEVQNRQALLRAACRHGADWILCCDADERFETRFLEEMHSLVATPPATVMGLHLVALWETLQMYRIGKAFKYVLFPAIDPKPYYRRGLLHQPWYPPQFETCKKLLDYNIYHLGSLTQTDRQERYEKFERIDPHHQHQPQGYRNIIDETNLKLQPISSERAFRYE
jgi:glycosyltransferase involved in cell wall biosynthesis